MVKATPAANEAPAAGAVNLTLARAVVVRQANRGKRWKRILAEGVDATQDPPAYWLGREWQARGRRVSLSSEACVRRQEGGLVVET